MLPTGPPGLSSVNSWTPVGALHSLTVPPPAAVSDGSLEERRLRASLLLFMHFSKMTFTESLLQDLYQCQPRAERTLLTRAALASPLWARPLAGRHVGLRSQRQASLPSFLDSQGPHRPSKATLLPSLSFLISRHAHSLCTLCIPHISCSC